LTVRFTGPKGVIEFTADEGMAEIFALFRKSGGDFIKGHWGGDY
jgi:hypothetical protein